MRRQIITLSKFLTIIKDNKSYEKISILDFNKEFYIAKLYRNDKLISELFVNKLESVITKKEGCQNCARLVTFVNSPRKFCIQKNNVLYYMDFDYYLENQCKDFCKSFTLQSDLLNQKVKNKAKSNKYKVFFNIKQGNQWKNETREISIKTDNERRIESYIKQLLNKRVKEGTVQDYNNVIAIKI